MDVVLSVQNRVKRHNVTRRNLSHRTLAQHYFLDALDLHRRFKLHWEDQPRKSSRIKSFVDLMMACECMLKAQCILAKSDMLLGGAYAEMKKRGGHNVIKLSRMAESRFPSASHEAARRYFGDFSVGLRYSADAHEYFFPIDRAPSSRRQPYSATLGSSQWLASAEAVVAELIDWGKGQFTGEVIEDIEDILDAQAEVEKAVGAREKRGKDESAV